jgi:hypothetical protein
VQADFAVELGADDETLEMPWAAERGGPRYCDVKRHPELLVDVAEAQSAPEIRQFLCAVNASAGALETAKCDLWSSTDINAEEEIFGATHKFGSYVDLLFSDASSRFSFAQHEQLAKMLTGVLQQAPEIPATAEFLIRRCYYHDEKGIRDGFYITFYLFGYGNGEAQSRERWAIGLKRAEDAIRSQCSSKASAEK